MTDHDGHNQAPTNQIPSPEVAAVTIGKGGTKIDADVATGEQESLKGKKFGTFNGVFRPTILTILGVMLYLREGWVVGNAGLFGADTVNLDSLAKIVALTKSSCLFVRSSGRESVLA